MTIPGLHRDDRVPKEILFYEAIQKQVDDLPRFVDEMCRRFDALGQETFTQFGDVREITICGDKAIGHWTPPVVKTARAAKSKVGSTGQSGAITLQRAGANPVSQNWRQVVHHHYRSASTPVGHQAHKLLKTEVESLFVYLCCSTGAVIPVEELKKSKATQSFSEKRYGELRMGVRPVYGNNDPTVHVARLTRAQAKKLIDYLAAEGYLGQAVELAKQEVPERDLSKNCYTLQVSTEKLQLHEDLGWGPGMLKRLDGLRGALDGEAAQAMDAILAQLRQ